MSHSNKTQFVKLANPYPAGCTHVSLSRARRLVEAKIAKWDAVGRLVMLFIPEVVTRKLRGEPICNVTKFSGKDALGKDRAVLPPSPEVLYRMLGSSRPVRPPLREASN